MSLGIGPHDHGCECDRCEGRRAELLQDVALKLDLANMELQTIDSVLARRPALAGLKHRTEKIERACQVNGELLRALQDLLFVIEVPSHWGAVQKEAFQLATKKAEAAIRNANGQ